VAIFKEGKRCEIKMKKIKPIKFIFCLLLTALCYPGCMKKNLPYSARQLQAVVDEYLKDKKNILGTIVQVDLAGRQSYTAANGFFDLSRKIPIRPNDKFIIGSVTKVFTAVLALQLVEQGKVELQRPIIDYLPSAWVAVMAKIRYGSEITVEQALSHRSGIANVTETEEFRKMLISAPLKAWQPIEIMRLTMQKGETRFVPGKGYDYCNTNYLLLGALVENVAGQPFSVALKRNILDRSGIDKTFLSAGTFGSGKGGIAHGYYTAGSKIYDGQEVNVGWAQAAGGVISTADDLVRFFKALVSQKLFEKKESFEQMARIAGGNEQYGLGLMVFDDPEIGIYYGHGGSFCGTRTMLAYFPAGNITVAICHTYCESNVGPGGDKLMKLVLKDILHDESEVRDRSEAGARDFLAASSKICRNEDKPASGNWDFALKELWSTDKIDGKSIRKGILFDVDRNGDVYLLDPPSGEIFVLDAGGKHLSSFANEEQNGYPSAMFVTADRIHIFETGNTINWIKVLDKNGNFKNYFKNPIEVSPRSFPEEGKFLAVRTASDTDKSRRFDMLEQLTLNDGKGLVIGKFPAEEKLMVAANLSRGRVHVMFDDIELFPKLIMHLNKGMLFLGRSDKYLVKKIALNGDEVLSFTIEGRGRKSIPVNFRENKIAGIGLVGGEAMPDAMKKEIFAGIPDRQVFFTDITTDEQGLIYVFVSDLGSKGKQEIDVFSPDGRYLYHGVIELAAGLEKVKPVVLSNEYLFVLAKKDNGDVRLFKYKIKRPAL
jgi:D-alanyl-D-alanine carboxypeptidase